MKKFRFEYRHYGATKKCVVLVDDEDACLLRAETWLVKRRRGRLYVRKMLPGGKEVLLHHVIAGSDDRVDFRNGNSLDCRRENLCTNWENLDEAREVHRLLALAGCYRPFYSELRPT